MRLYEAFPHGPDLALVLEFMTTDLYQLMDALPRPMRESHVKACMQMILRGVAACHSRSIMHRDIKPSNVLIDASGVLKLGDFGQACVYCDTNAPYSNQVATRWYRAPELLFGSRSYDLSVDMWSVGCIFGELLNHCPLFPGENDIDQLVRIFQLLGTPDEHSWPVSCRFESVRPSQ